MPRAWLDDQFHSNPKVRQAGNAAAGVYARALSFCAAYLTDGYISDADLNAISKRNERQNALKASLFERVQAGETRDVTVTRGKRKGSRFVVTMPGDGYYIPDWLDYNESRQESQKTSADKAAAGRKGAAARWSQDDDTSHGNSHSTSHDSSHDTSHTDEHGTSHGKTMARARGPFPSTSTPQAVALDAAPDNLEPANATPVDPNGNGPGTELYEDDIDFDAILKDIK